MEMDLHQLQIMVEDMKSNIRMQECAKFIQAWWRGQKVRMLYNLKKIKAAVKVISRFIKKVRMKTFIKSIKNHKKIEAGMKITKYLRGYKVNKDYYEEKKYIKLYKHIDDWEEEKK